jgi:hypothetical protein
VRRAAIAGALVALTALAPARALAQGSDKAAAAQVLFDEAMALLKKGRAADACPKLEESVKLDPGMAAQFRLAECYEQVGRVASAWALFIEVRDAARAQGNAERATLAQRRADAVAPRLAHVRIALPPAARVDGLVLTRDGVPLGAPLWNTAIPVDPGPHVIAARAPGKREISINFEAQPAATVKVDVPALADAPAPAARASGNGGRVGAIVLALGGLAGVGVGAGLGLTASTDWNAVKSNCPTFHGCDPATVTKANDASRSATISTIGFIAGGALLAGAVVVFVAARPSKTEPAPATAWIAPGLGGLTIGGSL